jgi:tetratricopeptide (TPR) repeat protein
MLLAMRILAIATVLAATRIAAAQPGSASGSSEATQATTETKTESTTEASAAFQRGRDLAKLGRYTEACVEFGKSYELDPALGTAVNLADCLERQGQLYRAWELFDLVARSSPSVQSRARLARARADALAARFATVIVTLRDPTARGLAVRIGEHAVTPAPQIRDLVEPRDVEIVATVPGRPAFRTTLRATAGATVTVDVPALAAPAEPPAPGEPRRRRSFVYLAGGLGAAGALGLGASLIVGLGARSDYRAALGRECLPVNTLDEAGFRMCRARVDHAGTRADHATELAVAGGVLAAAAAAVYLTAPREALQLTPVATGRELGLGVAGRF